MAEARDPRRPENIDVEVGRLVRVQRIARGLSQTELGDQIGVTFQQVQKYESGANRISMGRLTRISRVLGVDITYLLGASRPPPVAGLAPKAQADLTKAVGMLGRVGALRLVRAFNALPEKPALLRATIVQLVEVTASAEQTNQGGRPRRAGSRKRSKG
jgi:transcriptional regulator with XRE-family HTH domain